MESRDLCRDADQALDSPPVLRCLGTCKAARPLLGDAPSQGLACTCIGADLEQSFVEEGDAGNGKERQLSVRVHDHEEEVL